MLELGGISLSLINRLYDSHSCKSGCKAEESVVDVGTVLPSDREAAVLVEQGE
jgi:hypothetical protein